MSRIFTVSIKTIDRELLFSPLCIVIHLEACVEKIKDKLKSIVFNTPVLFRLFLKHRFGVEQQLINGNHETKSTHPSIIHFSLNKAATQFTKKLLKQSALENGITAVHINEYAFFTEFPYLTGLTEEEMASYQHIFKPRGYLYSAFGGFVPGIPNLDKYKVVLMIRDPRDILVSWYYSIAYSHSIPPETSNRHDEYVEHRISARELTVDEHVVSQSERVFDILHRYRELLVKQYPHVFVTSYEEMTTDFEGWLRRLLEACDLQISESLFERFIAYNRKIQPPDENKYQHIRKGKPGDYLEKLNPDTIAYLNEKFSPILAAFEDELNPE